MMMIIVISNTHTHTNETKTLTDDTMAPKFFGHNRVASLVSQLELMLSSCLITLNKDYFA